MEIDSIFIKLYVSFAKHVILSVAIYNTGGNLK